MKFEKKDKEYLYNRKKLSDKYGKRELWSLIDHWPLYTGISNLSRVMAISDILKSTLDIPGHIVEFGSWKGANLMLMAKLLQIFDPMSAKLVYGFEGFEGLSDFDSKDSKEPEKLNGQYKGNYGELVDFIELYDLNDSIEIVKGNILDTLPSFLKRNEGISFSLIYCDTDLYATTKLILESLHHRLSLNGMFILDEWNYENWPGESIAVREFLEAHRGEYEMLHIRNTRQPTLGLKRIK